jgi:ketosteroid isomerase-like protein
MNKISCIVLAAICCFFAVSVSAQQDPKHGVEKALTDYFNALAVQDLSTLKRYSTDEILILENGATWNMDTIVNRVALAKGLVLKRTNHIRFLRTEVHGDQGFVAYDNRAEIMMADRTVNRHWLESANLVKQDGVWKIWFLHSTSLEK